MPFLETRGIENGYGEVQVLWGVSIGVEKGSITSLLGSNGAGKTTMLKTIVGLLKPWAGKVLFENRDVTRLPAHRRVELGMALVPEGRHIFPEMSVRENLELGAYTERARRLMEDTMDWVFTLFPILRTRQGQLAGTLSGGEQQMLAIARALMSRPKLLLLDEPSLGLAPKIVDQVFATVRRLREEGITILLVEQHVQHALEMSDKAYVMENGRIVLEGRGKELLKNPMVKKAYLGL